MFSRLRCSSFGPQIVEDPFHPRVIYNSPIYLFCKVSLSCPKTRVERGQNDRRGEIQNGKRRPLVQRGPRRLDPTPLHPRNGPSTQRGPPRIVLRPVVPYEEWTKGPGDGRVAGTRPSPGGPTTGRCRHFTSRRKTRRDPSSSPV